MKIKNQLVEAQFRGLISSLCNWDREIGWMLTNEKSLAGPEIYDLCSDLEQILNKFADIVDPFYHDHWSEPTMREISYFFQCRDKFSSSSNLFKELEKIEGLRGDVAFLIGNCINRKHAALKVEVK